MKILWQSTGFFLLCASLLAAGRGEAAQAPLQVITESRVDPDGRVQVWLTLKNRGSEPLLKVQPLFHFHHSRSPMSPIQRLEPGQEITLENTGHPPVRRAGRYPLAVRVSYREGAAGASSRRQSLLHTDSFFYREPVRSEIDGRIESVISSESSVLKVQLRNHSRAFKNVRLMLHLPPGLEAGSFRTMRGFTLRGGEERTFEVPVRHESASLKGEFPVFLTIEYGEMLKHYTGEIRGTLRLDPLWNFQRLWPHLVGMGVLVLVLSWIYFRKWKSPRGSRGTG